MLWFRVAAVVFIFIVLVWGAGIAWGVMQMFSYGGTTKSMVDDPGRNGTVTIYVCLCAVEILIICSCIFGLVIGFRMWRNNYQIDHSLRHLFIIWLAMWGVSCVICLSIGIFMLVKGKDNQENMAVLYDTFQRNSQDPKFVATLEKYQRENQCCGVYSSDDWFMLQLRQAPMGGGGGGGYQSLDYGFRQNPSTGKCHMVPPTIPPGCGLRMMEEIQFKLKIYAAASVAETIIAAITGALSWYCFFYWLEKEVIVIPEDEVSNVIIIEPESEATVVDRGPSYLPPGHGQVSQRQMSRVQSQRNNLSRAGSQLGSRSNRGSYYHRNVVPSALPYESRGGYLHQSAVREQRSPQLIHLSHEAILKEQEEALGGKVLAEMHVEHKKTKMIKATGSKAGQHHATVAIVRNKHPPKPKQVFQKVKGHHGQTGNLAQDITDMSGGKAKGYIEDVVIPVEPPGVKPHAVQIPIGAVVHSTTQPNNGKNSGLLGFASHEMRATNAQNAIEGIIAPEGEEKEKGRVLSVVVSRPHELTHPKYLQNHLDYQASQNPHHHNDPYLPDGGHHHDPYLADGGHHQHDPYLADGGHHQHDPYLADGGHHQHDSYLADGGHHHPSHHNPYLHDVGQHQHTKYLQDGGHHSGQGQGHYLPDGNHRSKYLPEDTQSHHHRHDHDAGQHHDRYLADGGPTHHPGHPGHDHEGGQHGHGKYLADGGPTHHGHGHDRYLADGNGGHQGRYLHDGGPHHQGHGHYLPEGGQHHHGHNFMDSHHHDSAPRSYHSREYRKATTILFKSSKPIEDSD